MNRHMQQIDHQTGEVVEGFCGLCCSKAQKRISERMDGNGSRSNDDACSKQFNRQRHEGYVAMLARLDYENLIQVNQAEVSEQVGMNRHNVNRSIKKLIEIGVILEGVKIGISRLQA